MSNHNEPPVTDESETVQSNATNNSSNNTTNDTTGQNPNSEMDNLKTELEEARKKAAENWDLFLRSRADVDNARRRAMLDVENAHKYGIEKFAKEILAVVDSLDHGLLATKGSNSTDTTNAEDSTGSGRGAGNNDQSLREGMELTYKLLLDTLDKFGIKQIDPIGEPFDPIKHEALSTQPNGDVAPNIVLVVIQKGFTMHDRLLRPARVIVSRALEAT